MSNYDFTKLSDLELEKLDQETIKSYQALTAYSNRALSKAKRQKAMDYIVAKSQAITAEQIRRENEAA